MLVGILNLLIWNIIICKMIFCRFVLGIMGYYIVISSFCNYLLRIMVGK